MTEPMTAVEKKAAYWKAQKAKRKAEGMCPMCGKRKPSEGYVTCEECRTYQREHKQRKLAEGVCARCNKAHDTGKQHCEECARRACEEAKATRDRNRDLVFEAYGGYVCCCCGETNPVALEVDHKYNDGNVERKTLFKRPTNGVALFPSIIRRGFPPIYQILCSNCNRGKHRNKGTCPHQTDPHRPINRCGETLPAIDYVLGQLSLPA